MSLEETDSRALKSFRNFRNGIFHHLEYHITVSAFSMFFSDVFIWCFCLCFLSQEQEKESTD